MLNEVDDDDAADAPAPGAPNIQEQVNIINE